MDIRSGLDCDNLFAAKFIEFNPYVDVSYVHSHMDVYTETGGGLPAQFDSRNDHSRELRKGLNLFKTILNTKLQLGGNLEDAHRFNDIGAATAGQVNGLFTFKLPIQSYQSTWINGGVGMESELGKDKASLMPNAWLAASY